MKSAVNLPAFLAGRTLKLVEGACWVGVVVVIKQQVGEGSLEVGDLWDLQEVGQWGRESCGHCSVEDLGPETDRLDLEK